MEQNKFNKADMVWVFLIALFSICIILMYLFSVVFGMVAGLIWRLILPSARGRR